MEMSFLEARQGRRTHREGALFLRTRIYGLLAEKDSQIGVNQHLVGLVIPKHLTATCVS